MPNNKTIREEFYDLRLNQATHCEDCEKAILFFIEKALLTQLQEIEDWGCKKRDDIDKDRYCRNETNNWKNGYDCAMIDLLSALKEKKDIISN